MDVRGFLERVLPSDGGKYFGATAKNNKFSQASLPSLDKLEAFIAQVVQRPNDVYFATGTFKDSRTAADCGKKKSLYLDIDCGPTKGYPTKHDALTELYRFCKVARLPHPSIVIDSGGGIHAYWTFDTAVTTGVWQPMADALKALCDEHQFMCDPSITADAARVLRVPLTYNYKTGQPIPVRILREGPDDFPVASLQKALAAPTLTPINTSLAALVGDDDLSGGMPSFPADAKQMIAKCGVLSHSMETGGEGQSEPLWMSQLNLLAFTENGAEYIHDISNGHAGYTRAGTERKYQLRIEQIERSGIGPTLCKTLERYHPEICAKCPFNGRIKSPIVLGRNSVETGSLPRGYVERNGWIFRAVAPRGADEDMSMRLVLTYNVTDFDVHMMEGDLGAVYSLTFSHGHAAIPTRFTSQDLSEPGRLRLVLARQEVFLKTDEYREFVAMIDEWSKQMREVKKFKTAITALGWSTVGDEPAFVLATEALTATDSHPVVLNDRALVAAYTPAGSPEYWLALARHLTSENRHAITAGLLAGFAAPLMRFTNVHGCALSLISRKSGTGKSTALSAAQAIWGHPTRGLNALNDTANAVVHRMGKLRHMPVFWDELHANGQVKRFVELLFQVSQGKEKARLSSTVESREVGTWATLITVASNHSLLDHVRLADDNTDAGQMRVFEVTVPEIDNKNYNPQVGAWRGMLEDNYGHIGPMYARYLLQNLPAVERMVATTRDRLTLNLGAGREHRFWTATCAVLFTAAAIANKLNFTRIDLNLFHRWLAGELVRCMNLHRETYHPTRSHAQQYVFDYLEEFRDQLVVFDRLSGKGNAGGDVGRCHSMIPRGEVLGVIGREDNKIRIKKRPFEKWVYENCKESPSRIVDELKMAGAVERKASVSVGVPNTVPGRALCLELPLNFQASIPVAPEPSA